MSKIYPIHKDKDVKGLLKPMNAFITEKAVRSQYPLWLRDRLEKDDNDNIYTRYRLIAKDPHSEQQALSYDIKCPKCGGRLKMISMWKDAYELGEYACKDCDERSRKR